MSYTRLDEANERLQHLVSELELSDPSRQFGGREPTEDEEVELKALREKMYSVMDEITNLKADPNKAYSRFYS
jgi:division protein CdvB (Snf7/Vps24/ESCRT-III family)